MANLPEATHFKSLQEKAKLFALKTCKNMQADPTGSIDHVQVLLNGTDHLVDKGRIFSFKSVLYEVWTKAFNPQIFNGMQELAYDFAFNQPDAVTNVDNFKGLITRKSDECADGNVSTCEYILEYRSSTAEVTYHFYANTEQSRRQKAECDRLGFSSCAAALEDLRRAIAPYNYFIKAGHINTVIKTLHSLNKQWNRFSENSRHQTFIDKLLTTTIYQDQFNGKDWAGPPKYQYFMIHPDLVLDQYSMANHGEQTKVSLALEWGGINKWDGKVPLGFSVATVYSDRSVGKRFGTGAMFHIDNDYSIGVVYRGDNHYSVFVNLNLFNWFTEKQDKYDLYKDKFQNIRAK